MIDNANETQKKIVGYILKNAPDGLIRRDKLEQFIPPKGSIYLSWVRDITPSWDATVNLEVHFESTSNKKTVEDPTGTTWLVSNLVCQVTWPSHGGCGLDIAQARLGLMLEVTKFAQALQDAFPEPLTTILETKQDKEERLKEAEESSTQRTLKTILANASELKGMRVGASKFLYHTDITSDFDGRQVRFSNKSYQVSYVSSSLDPCVKVTRTE